MASRARSGAPSPSPHPVGPPRRRDDIPEGIDWRNVPFGPDEAPEGKWGQNADGDWYISCPDKSYHYFNADGSYYSSDGRPGLPNAPGRSIYVSPRGERFRTPATEDLDDGEYFIGRHWLSGVENIYWEHSDGKIERSFRQNVDLGSQRLDWDFVAVGDRFRPQVVDRNGRVIRRRARNAWVPGLGREELRRRGRGRGEGVPAPERVRRERRAERWGQVGGGVIGVGREGVRSPVLGRAEGAGRGRW